MNEKILGINWDSNNIPTLPSVAHKLIFAAGEGETGIAEIATIIEQDPSLALKVLKAANSAFYALNLEITSIKHATVLLGMDEVKKLALGFLLASNFLSVSKQIAKEAEALWKHLLATAVFAQDLQQGSEQDPDLYTLGLLHDLGWLVLMSEYPDTYKKIANWNTTLFEAENELGIDHQLWGAKLAEKWGLPEPFQVVNFRHHYPCRELASPRYLLQMHIANYLADKAGFIAVRPDSTPLDPCAVQGLGLDDDTMEEMEQACLNESGRIEELWEIMTG